MVLRITSAKLIHIHNGKNIGWNIKKKTTEQQRGGALQTMRAPGVQMAITAWTGWRLIDCFYQVTTVVAAYKPLP